MVRLTNDQMVGLKFGRLTIQTCENPIEGKSYRKVNYRCDCGNVGTGNFYLLKSGNIKSCGCLQSEQAKKNLPPPKHNQSKSRLYNTWRSMKKRCLLETDKCYQDYGGRGITVQSNWLDFEMFLKWTRDSGYVEGLSLERSDVDGGYNEDNCEWVPKEAQARNKRVSKSNRTGVVGVSYYENIGTYGYRACWRDCNGKNKSKSFSAIKYGLEQAFNLACDARRDKIEGLKAEGISYGKYH